VFTGIVVVSGAMDFTAAAASSPIAVLLVHGSADEHVNYEGGAPRSSIGRAGERRDASVQDAIDYYLERNDLRGYPESQKEGKVRTETYAITKEGKQSRAPLRVITLEGGGHSWPGSATKPRVLADTPFPFDASRAIVAFLAGLQPERPAGGTPAVPR
jgi:polyhydroxybutyrate depolymerase